MLRACAVLLVLGRHFDSDLPVLAAWRRIGWGGVDLFFVLSGFLISGLLFREYRASGRVRIGRFLVRRGLKIYPAFYVLTIATVLAGQNQLQWRRIAVESLFVQDYFRGIQVHTWSLGVEEQFYLFFAVLMLAMVYYARVHAVPWLFAIVAVFALVCRVIVVVRQGANQWAVLLPAHKRMDALFCGVLIAYLYWFHREAFDRISRKRWILPGSGVCLLPWLVLDVDHSVWMLSLGLTLNYVGFGLLLIWSLQWSMWHGLAPLALIGEYSYSIYLWHIGVRTWVMDWLGIGSPTLPHFVAYIGLSIAWGMLMARLVELPVLRLRDRIMAASGEGMRANRPYYPVRGVTSWQH